MEDRTTVPPQVGASVTHSSLGMVTYKHRRKYAELLEGSMDLLLQGHIFSPRSVDEDQGAEVIKGTICSEDLHSLLSKRSRWQRWGSSKR